MTRTTEPGTRDLRLSQGFVAAILLGALSFAVTETTAQTPEPQEEEYLDSVIEEFTGGEIIELSDIPDTEIFSRFLEDQAQHEDISVEELRQTMLAEGIMKYLINLLRDGQISITEYVNLRPDIHWVEALRMAYVGGALELDPEWAQLMRGKVTSGVTKLRQGTDIVVREIAYRSSVQDIYPLYAEIAYDPQRKKAPVMVVMHGDIPGTRMGFIARVHDYAKKGFFALAVSKRGRDGSAGAADTFGVEIYDIYDAVEHVKNHYLEHVNPSNINITGRSAGGMDSIAAVVHFPDYFRFSVPFFGSPDVGDWMRQSGLGGKSYEQWLDEVKREGWPKGAIQLYTNVIEGAGGMLDEVPDKWMARDYVLGAINSPNTQIHMFWDEQDGVSPSITNRNRAYYDKTRELGYENVHLHYSQRGDPIRYLHWFVPDNARAQQYFFPQILAGSRPAPVLADAGRMVVVGYLKTKRYMVWLGTGENAVARLDYQLSPTKKEFRFRRLSSDRSVRGKLHLPNTDGTSWSVAINHEVVSTGVSDPQIVVEFGLDDVVVLKQ